MLAHLALNSQTKLCMYYNTRFMEFMCKALNGGIIKIIWLGGDMHKYKVVNKWLEENQMKIEGIGSINYRVQGLIIFHFLSTVKLLLQN